MRLALGFILAGILFSGALLRAEEEKIALNFQDAEAMPVLEFYARLTGKTFIPEDDLRVRFTIIAPGPVTKKTALDMLDTVLGMKGYSLIEREEYFKVVRKQGPPKEPLRRPDADTPGDRYVTEIIDLKYVEAKRIEEDMKKLISPDASLVANQALNTLVVTDTNANIKKLKDILARLDVSTRGPQTKVYVVQYGDVEKLLPLLTQLMADGVKDESQKPLLVADKDSRQLVVTGTPLVHTRLEQLLPKLDQRFKQVYIDVSIVEWTTDKENRLGFEWAGVLQNEKGINGPTDTNEKPALKQQNIQGDLGLINGANPLAGLLGLKYALLKPNQYRLLAETFSTNQNAKILSQPHLMTMDGKEAKLTVGEEIPILKEFRLDANNNPIRTFDQQKVGINTSITPKIAENRDVVLAIKQEVSNVLSVNTVDFSTRIGQRLAESNVIVRDGHTLVIGGLMRDEDRISIGGIPLLKDIPGLGAVFRRKTVTPSRSELLIFITPRVVGDVKESDAVNEHSQMKHEKLLDLSGEEFRL
jgi:general secretion pathway protein D